MCGEEGGQRCAKGEGRDTKPNAGNMLRVEKLRKIHSPPRSKTTSSERELGFDLSGRKNSCSLPIPVCEDDIFITFL